MFNIINGKSSNFHKIISMSSKIKHYLKQNIEHFTISKPEKLSKLKFEALQIRQLISK